MPSDFAEPLSLLGFLKSVRMLKNFPAVSLLPQYSVPLRIISPTISFPSPITTPFSTSDSFPFQSSVNAAHLPRK